MIKDLYGKINFNNPETGSKDPRKGNYIMPGHYYEKELIRTYGFY